jgi:hypothetical protein
VDDMKSGRHWMFRCQQCGSVTPPRVSSELVVVETRSRVYLPRERAQRPVFSDGRVKKPMHNDPGGVGREIVRESRVCPSCKAGLEIVPAPDLR